ncbi:unnamed protein product [Litomosoides sigmodontis]|uniref:Uncharacterized protein n=1 Tax=Litomosoides sigmodontis TaxID=42156 RepID=A0A3P6U262_LITSI|nr:unnamed protein product [Litomosoides sigmodontis]
MEHEGEALDNTIHLFRDKLKETAGHAGEVAHEAVERAKHTASDVLPEIVRDVSNASQKTRGVGADVLHSLDESASSAMHSFKGEFDDAVHGILDATHHATDAFENTLQEANPPGDAFKGAAAQVHSAEGGLVDLKQEIKNTDLYARTEANDATKPANEDLIRLSDEINNASERDARHGAVFKQPLDGAHQDVRYPSQQWGLDWRQHANEGARIDALRSGFDVKADHPTDDGSAEESMLERKGPLTIPRQSPDDIIQLDRSFDWSKQSGFEVSPRPPTPPKELDDEDVKPTTIDLGQTVVSGEHPSSILKNSTQGVKFNFKDMDARCKLSMLHRITLCN